MSVPVVSDPTTTTAAQTAAPQRWRRGPGAPVAPETLARVDAWWRAANYLSVGQIYLRSNPLMRSDWTDEKTGETQTWCYAAGLRDYLARVDQATARQKQAVAKAARDRAGRDARLQQNAPGAISPEAFQQAEDQLLSAEADVAVAQAQLDQARLNLDFTHGQMIIMTIMAAPKMSIRALSNSRNTSWSPMSRNAPSTTPAMLPEPPRITMANRMTDS